LASSLNGMVHRRGAGHFETNWHGRDRNDLRDLPLMILKFVELPCLATRYYHQTSVGEGRYREVKRESYLQDLKGSQTIATKRIAHAEPQR
jgi:hypothetical protein